MSQFRHDVADFIRASNKLLEFSGSYVTSSPTKETTLPTSNGIELVSDWMRPSACRPFYILLSTRPVPKQ